MGRSIYISYLRLVAAEEVVEHVRIIESPATWRYLRTVKRLNSFSLRRPLPIHILPIINFI